MVLVHWFGTPLLIGSRTQTGQHMARSDRVLCLNLALVPKS